MQSLKPVSKRGKAWPRHTPGRKETAGITAVNRVAVFTEEERAKWATAGFRAIPLKRKYLTNRAYLQAASGSPAAPRSTKKAFFPMSRNRAIPSSLAIATRPNR